MNITCVYAYPAEVEHFQRLNKNAKLTHHFAWVCWRREKGAALPEFNSKSDLIINLGFAGSLNDRLPIGTVALISEITVLEKCGPVTAKISSDYQKIVLKSTRFHDIPTAKLLSSQTPVVSSKRKKELAALCGADLVDMEAYWVHQAAVNLDAPFISFKIVSDNADEAALSQTQTNKSKLSKKLSEVVGDVFY